MKISTQKPLELLLTSFKITMLINFIQSMDLEVKSDNHQLEWYHTALPSMVTSTSLNAMAPMASFKPTTIR